MTGTAQHGGFAIELGGAGGRPPLCHITGGAAAPWGGSPEGGQGPQGGAGLGRGEPLWLDRWHPAAPGDRVLLEGAVAGPHGVPRGGVTRGWHRGTGGSGGQRAPSRWSPWRWWQGGVGQGWRGHPRDYGSPLWLIPAQLILADPINCCFLALGWLGVAKREVYRGGRATRPR